MRLLSFFDPAAPIAPLPDAEVQRRYPRLRIQMMASIFVGYAAFYIVRSNFSLAKPLLKKELTYDTGDLGFIATCMMVAYGVSKFVMGAVSDRSNARVFMAVGLLLSALANLLMGFTPWVWGMAALWLLNGWFQGMGWPPCGRVITHWFSDRERGTQFSIWNLAHNVGGGIVAPIVSVALLAWASWHSTFIAPALVAAVIGVLLLVFLRDTPQSVGLPPIEKYKDDYPPTAVADREKELTVREIMFQYVFPNRYLWLLAFANVFVYVLRYGVANWAPLYLTEVKQVSQEMARWNFSVFEYAGIPGMLFAGFASDRLFGGRRAPVAVLYMLVVSAGVFVYWFNPPGNPWVDFAALAAIGCFIYGPVMLLGIAAVDLVPKKACGAAAGFIGMFGYMAGAVTAELVIGFVVKHFGWDSGFALLGASCVLGTVLLLPLWNVHSRTAHPPAAQADSVEPAPAA